MGDGLSLGRRGLLAAAPALVSLVVLAAAPVARADAGELALGAGLSLELPMGYGVDALAQLGLSDSLAVRAALGPRFDGEVALDATLGLVALWDVLAWVPELVLSGGVRAADASLAPQASLSLGVRRYLSPTLAVSTALGAGVRDGDAFAVLAFALWLL